VVSSRPPPAPCEKEFCASYGLKLPILLAPIAEHVERGPSPMLRMGAMARWRLVDGARGIAKWSTLSGARAMAPSSSIYGMDPHHSAIES